MKILPSAELTRWMKERVSTINSYYKVNNPEGKSIHHYLWVTGNVYNKDLKRLDSFKEKNKKIDVDYLFGEAFDDFLHKKKRVFDLYRKVISPDYIKGPIPEFELEDDLF